MLEVKNEEIIENEEVPKEEVETTEETTTAEPAVAAPEPPPPPQTEQNNSEGTLNPLNEQENNADAESKTKHRRYWTPKEEEKFHEIWGRENWRLTKHGKNTIFFAKWSDEMRERFNIDVKPEEVQCKVNQTRAKFRQVKKHLEADKNAVKWKKYDIVEKILKNQYRSKDDEPVPLEALENNRDVSPTELQNCFTQPPSPSSISNMSTIAEQGINLSQSLNADHQLTDEVNMSSASLSDQNLFCNNSQSGNSFSTELFGSDQLEIKQEIENDLKCEGFTELSGFNEQSADAVTTDGSINNTTDPQIHNNQSHLHQHLTQQTLPPQVPHAAATENSTNMESLQIQSANPNSLLIKNRVVQNHNNSNINNVAADNSMVNFTNHANINNNNSAMQPPRAVAVAASPRKRNRSSSISTTVTPITSETLETLYLEEVRKKNVILVEQGEINRKRLRLEERKVKLMEEFFPKFMNLQQEILQKLENVTKTSTDITN
ncbi:myb-like protein I [Calliphora vicina]|uniref:myb-like protein I n=1 Tax=Calliphora vicina TaxID=7373 RepID=UPI00325B4475